MHKAAVGARHVLASPSVPVPVGSAVVPMQPAQVLVHDAVLGQKKLALPVLSQKTASAARQVLSKPSPAALAAGLEYPVQTAQLATHRVVDGQ